MGSPVAVVESFGDWEAWRKCRHLTMRSAGSGRLLAAFAQPAFMQTGPGVLDFSRICS